MTREEMINEVVKEYFRGGNWQSYLKHLVREMKKNENNFDSANSMRNSFSDNTDCV